MNIWWVRSLFALIFLILSYGFISLAIDSGSMLHWGLGLLFLGLAVNDIVRAVQYGFDR